MYRCSIYLSFYYIIVKPSWLGIVGGKMRDFLTETRGFKSAGMLNVIGFNRFSQQKDRIGFHSKRRQEESLIRCERPRVIMI